MLKAKVPACYKDGFKQRFNSDNAQLIDGFWKIEFPCPLCEHYLVLGCNGCPFTSTDKHDFNSCISWLEAVLEGDVPFVLSVNRIYWINDQNKEAREQLAKLRAEAEKLIEWV